MAENFPVYAKKANGERSSTLKKTVIVEAPGKINLSLDVADRRPDGYHNIHSVMQAIDLYDTITLSRMSGSGIYVSCDRTRIPCDENNLAHIAARCFFEAFQIEEPGALSIDLRKRIPSEAGLAGGSADAAGVLVGLNTLYEIYASPIVLCRIGTQVGADVPFCILGGTCEVRGIGDKLEPIAPLPRCNIVIAKPPEGISTIEGYRRYDALTPPPRADVRTLIRHLQCGDLKGIAASMQNVLEQAANLESVSQIKQQMLETGALGAAMSGSGSAVFCIMESRTLAKRCMHKLYDRSEGVFIVRPDAHGARVVSTT